MLFLARVYVMLKPTVNDPQGRTVLGGLQSLGFTSVVDVRAGKYLEIRVHESDKEKARTQVAEMCDKLLANPVLEEYRFELEEIP